MPLVVERSLTDLITTEALVMARLRQDERQGAPRWVPMAHQEPPPGTWRTWLLEGGRGIGKTEGAAHYVDDYAKAHPYHRIGIIAPKFATARSVCVEGETGLLSVNPGVRFNRSLYELRWPNGAQGQIFGAYGPEDVEALRGPQFHLIWAEELAAWPQLDGCWNNMQFGLRLGDNPHAIATSTPKPRATYKRIRLDERTVITHATTRDNPNLHPSVRAELERQYGGTRLGRQELGGELLEDVEGALWQYAWIDQHRASHAPELTRIVVAIDPAATHGENADYTGIAAAGLGVDGDYYVLRADQYRLSPSGWATRAVDLYHELKADRIVAETNNGGDMVEHTIRQVWRDAPFKKITASRGKQVRAEPVALLYEQGRVHHVGIFAALEDQQCAFPVANEHDDLVDADVYAITELAEGIRTKIRAS